MASRRAGHIPHHPHEGANGNGEAQIVQVRSSSGVRIDSPLNDCLFVTETLPILQPRHRSSPRPAPRARSHVANPNLKHVSRLSSTHSDGPTERVAGIELRISWKAAPIVFAKFRSGGPTRIQRPIHHRVIRLDRQDRRPGGIKRTVRIDARRFNAMDGHTV